MRLVVDNIRGKNVWTPWTSALHKRGYRRMAREAGPSAIANWEHKLRTENADDYDLDQTAFVDEGTMLKRFHFCTGGRTASASRTNHVTIIVENRVLAADADRDDAVEVEEELDDETTGEE